MDKAQHRHHQFCYAHHQQEQQRTCTRGARVVVMMGGSRSSTKNNQKKKKGFTRTNDLVVDNRLARMKYEFVETYQCGVELVGTEIKSVRAGQMNIRDAYCRVSKDNQLYLHNAHIAKYSFSSSFFNHEPTRVRKLLLHKRDILKLGQKQAQQGLTIVPTRCYFTERGWLKVRVALARGKKLHDRRADIKARDEKREIQRALKTAVL